MLLPFDLEGPEIANHSYVLVAHQHPGHSELLKRRVEILDVEFLLFVNVHYQIFTSFVCEFYGLLLEGELLSSVLGTIEMEELDYFLKNFLLGVRFDFFDQNVHNNGFDHDSFSHHDALESILLLLTVFAGKMRDS